MKWITYLAFIVFGIQFQVRTYGQLPVFPDERWAVESPVEMNMDAELLDSVSGILQGRGCIIKDGYIVKSWGDQGRRSDWKSAVKPLFSTFLFFAVEEDLIPDVHYPISQLGWDRLEKDKFMEIYHLANMTSGYDLSEKPGTAWAYNDFAIQLYQKSLFEKIFREYPDKILASRLGNLNFQDQPYFRDDKPRFYASARDFARIGWLWLNHGEWNGQKILPESYFEKYMKPQVPIDLPTAVEFDANDYLHIGSFGGGANHFTKYGPGIYGFNWWFNSTGRLHSQRMTWPDATDETFMAIGAGGNVLAMVPELNLVLSCASGQWGALEPGDSDSNFNLVLKLLVEASH